jgi:hypothetical protein
MKISLSSRPICHGPLINSAGFFFKFPHWRFNYISALERCLIEHFFSLLMNVFPFAFLIRLKQPIQDLLLKAVGLPRMFTVAMVTNSIEFHFKTPI